MAKKKKVATMEVPRAASSMEDHQPVDITEWGFGDFADAAEAALVAPHHPLDDLAELSGAFRTKVTALCNYVSVALSESADNLPVDEQKRLAYELVVVMKQKLQNFEKSFAPTRLPPLDHQVSSDGAPCVTNGKEAMRPNGPLLVSKSWTY